MLVTVLAQNLPIQPCILCWHGGVRHLSVHRGPHPGHVLHGLPTRRTGIQPLLHHVLEAVVVEEVGARRYVSPSPAGVDILHTDRTVVVGSVGNTLVLLISW